MQSNHSLSLPRSVGRSVGRSVRLSLSLLFRYAPSLFPLSFVFLFVSAHRFGQCCEGLDCVTSSRHHSHPKCGGRMMMKMRRRGWGSRRKKKKEREMIMI